MRWVVFVFFFFSSRRRHTRSLCDWSSDVCSSDLSRRRASVERIDRRIDALLRDRPRQHGGRIEVGERGRRRRIGEVVGGQIGRASCRERVEISVGAGASKTNRKERKRYGVWNHLA